MKYSLRSLMIGITLICVLLGGRIEYLRRWAAYHKREHENWVQKAVRTPTGPFDIGIEPMLPTMNYHLQMEAEYRDAMRSPWNLVNENPPPPPAP